MHLTIGIIYLRVVCRILHNHLQQLHLGHHLGPPYVIQIHIPPIDRGYVLSSLVFTSVRKFV